MAATFKSITPNLVVADIERSAEFYREALGFTTITTVPEQAPFDFIMLERDGLQLFLNSKAAADHEGYQITIGSSGVTMYVVVDGIGILWKQMQARVPIASPLKKQFYGMTEFAIVDPDGNYITFAERIE